jgi:DNA ligase (NAD+)
MNQQEARERILRLSEEIHKYNHSYYVDNLSLVSDFDFDMLLKELEALEIEFNEFAFENSPTKRVGGDITKKFESVTHRFPMLSLGNTYSEEEIVDWVTRVQKLVAEPIEFVCELKYDGVAIGIRYENGQFSKAVTRGDGEKGEDVTNNVRTIRSIPLQLTNDYPTDFEIRGEIFMPHAQFQRINLEREAIGENLFANPRNTASGTLKMQDSKVVAERGLDSFLYGVYGDELLDNGHYESVLHAANWGFKTPNPTNKYIEKVNDINGIMDFIRFWDVERSNLSFDIDGIVIKVNNYQQQKSMGFTAKSPRWATSFKFKTKRVETELLEVTYQVGRTGSITPVANLTPVSIGGTTVKRASLHNADQIEKLALHENDTVFLEKGGEIIPKIVGVNLEKRLENVSPIVFIENCPICHTSLVRQEGEAHHYCPNESACPPQVKGKIQHFISRKALNIDGLGEETIELLYEKGLIKDIADLYTLQADQLLKLDRMAVKSVENLLTGLELSKNTNFERVLFGLGIRYVGETVAKKLVKAFKNIDALQRATYDELIEVEEIGGIIADSVIRYFSDTANLVLIDRLKNAGLCFVKENELLDSTTFLGKTLVISGSFSVFSREELKELIEKNGGKVGSSVSSKTDYLIAGENMGPAKLKKANSLGITIISEEEFVKLIS